MQDVSKLKDWEFELINNDAIKAYKNNCVGVIVESYRAQHDNRKSIAEHALYLLIKDIMESENEL